MGGGIQGGAGESSSFREGLFHETCLEYEIVTGDGTVLTASREQHIDLFWGTACSYGTLGVITLAKIRLIPATSFVQLTYQRVRSAEEMVEALRTAARSPVDFLDGIMFDHELGVVMTGIRADAAKGPVRRFSRAFDEHFYLHAKKVVKSARTCVESVPLTEYLFRYSRGGFWVAACAFRYGGVPFTRLTRTIFDPFLRTREMYDILHATNVSQQFIVQDISLPEDHALEFVHFTDTDLGIYPLWFCPLRPDPVTLWSPAYSDSDLVINVGIYGALKGQRYDYASLLAANRAIEMKAQILGGRKVLYAHTYYPREEFWNIYARDAYEALREKYHAATTFPDLYAKVFVGERYRPHVKKGLLQLARRKILGTARSV